MKAIILAVGSELTSGHTPDTNSAYLARELARLGIEASQHWTIGDEKDAIAATIIRGAELADLVLVSGGLGPTADDLTRGALAQAMGCELMLDKECLKTLEEFFRRHGREMAPANRVQAMIPAGAEALPNDLGTAPGLAAKIGRASVFVMPGVPHEMREMFARSVAPRLGAAPGVIIQKIIHTFGTGESDIGEKIEALMQAAGPVTVGTTVASGLISLRITSRAEDAETAELQAQETIRRIHRLLGDLVFGEGEETLASAVGRLLKEHSQTLATAESCTGGWIGQMITAVPGSSDYYLGGVVAYSNAAKNRMLSVPNDVLAADGAVSEASVQAMAEGCRKRFSSDWAIAVTGIAGPAGGSDKKPVGLVYIALAGPGNTEVHRNVFAGTREVVRRRAALSAINCLRLALIRPA